jgi:hypothetical protein
MLPINEIVSALKISRSEFGNCFLQAQVSLGVLRAQRRTFESVTQAADDKQAYTDALGEAQLHDWLDELVDIIVRQELETGEISRKLTEAAAKTDQTAELQAMVEAARGFEQPEIIYRGYNSAIRWTGKIFIDNKFQGTGVLIGPNLVLTAWHVVKKLFTNAGGEYKPVAINKANFLEVEFDDFLGYNLRPARSFRISAPAEGTDKWCVVFSPCHPMELAEKMPAPLTDLDHFWDYAVIRLSAAPGLERRWASFDLTSAVPRDEDSIVVFQHPDGQPLRSDRGAIASLKPPDPETIPKLRFLHGANTLGGSSGGPCFDRSFALFGLHQGAWKNAGNGMKANRGIPLIRVFQHLTDTIKALPSLEASESPLWKREPRFGNMPILGCDNFQASIWRSAIHGSPRLFIISGQTGIPGKSFRVDLLDEMLPIGGHLKIPLTAQAISNLSAVELAAKICESAGTSLADLLPPEGINSTQAVWKKDEILTKLIAALDAKRDKRLVWISIRDLNKFDIKNDSGSELLLLLYQQLLVSDWLRIVLDGMKGDIPLELRSTREDHVVAGFEETDLTAYIDRYLANMELPPDQPGLYVTAKLILKLYNKNVGAAPVSAMNDMLEQIMESVDEYAGLFV